MRFYPRPPDGYGLAPRQAPVRRSGLVHRSIGARPHHTEDIAIGQDLQVGLGEHLIATVSVFRLVAESRYEFEALSTVFGPHDEALVRSGVCAYLTPERG